MKRKMKKLTSLFLCIVLAMLMLPLTEISVKATETYELWVGGVQVTSENKSDILGDGGSVTFNPETNVLKLTNATIKNNPMLERRAGTAIFSAIDLILDLHGTNKIEASYSREGYFASGILAQEEVMTNLTIQGSGSLDITAYHTGYMPVGIDYYQITIKSGDVTVTANTGSSSNGIALSVNKLNVEGGTLTLSSNIKACYTPVKDVMNLSTGYVVYGSENADGSGATKMTDEDLAATDKIYKYIRVVKPTGIHKITFDANGGTCATASLYTNEEGKLSSIPYSTPPVSYASFAGWFLSGGSTSIDVGSSGTVFTKDTTVYARYVYPIKVYSGYGQIGSYTTKTITSTFPDATVTLHADAAPEGKVFDKWVVNEGSFTIANAKQADGASFTTKAERMSVTATYKDPSEEHVHSYVKTIVPASLTEDGKISFVCECGDVDSEEIIIPKAATPYFVVDGRMLSNDSYPYNGSVISPEVVIRDSKGNDIDPENYTVTVPSGRKDVGTYTYQIEYKGKYTGTFERTLKIDIAQVFERTGTNTSTGIKLTWEKAPGAGGYYIYKSTTGTNDYQRIKTVTGLTYTDTNVTNGVKYNYKIIPFKTVGSKTYKGTGMSVVQYFISRPAISSLTSPSKTKALVKWAKNSKATGYQIQYSPKSDFSSGKKTITISGNTTVSKTIGSLTSGKKYYVRIRTFKKVSTGNYYSAWSAVKAVTVK